MDVLESAWIIPLIPLAVAALIGIAGRRVPEPWAGVLATCAVGAGFVLTAIVFAVLLGEPEHERVFTKTLYDWIPAGGFQVELTYRIDPLSVMMMLLVTGVGGIIHFYAIGYMHGDERFTSFFSFLNLFIGSMLVLVMANDFLVLFVGWELVGLCSYLLIGFWYGKLENSSAANKAFITNRVGDFGFLVGLMLIFFTFGSLNFDAVFSLAPEMFVPGAATMTAICLLLLVGVTGKSAQIPLYMWLPDAMAGPTPVSALIHAATMVTAGVYLVARSYVLFDLAPTARLVVVAVGAVTVVFAAILAIGQFRLKRVLAFSTISQIGYMIAGVGIGGAGIVAGLFHLLMHGFFKALLFLCAGSIMHAMDGEEDQRVLGALRKPMPITHWTYLMAALAISGIFPWSGFWSKDSVLGALFTSEFWWGRIFWAIGLIGAFFTAIYIFRQYFTTFTGEPRWEDGKKPHESPWVMTLPLGILAILATVGGLIELPNLNFLERWLAPSFEAASPAIEPEVFSAETILLLTAGLVVAFGGVITAYLIWSRMGVEARARIAERLGPLVPFVRRKYYVDEAVNAVFVEGGRDVVDVLGRQVDERAIDGTVEGVGSLPRRLGDLLSKVQNGYLRLYGAVILGGVVLLLLYVIARVGVGSFGL